MHIYDQIQVYVLYDTARTAAPLVYINTILLSWIKLG